MTSTHPTQPVQPNQPVQPVQPAPTLSVVADGDPAPQPSTGSRLRVFTGLKPTGQLHLGNYLGAIRPVLALASDPAHDVTVSVADLHALTVTHDPHLLRQRTIEMAATLNACGLPDTARLFVQSTVPAYATLHYLIESVATYGEMHRMVQFKEKSEGQETHRTSLLTYPALMAADILGSQAQAVPVGDDQRQHLELTRAVARRFNRTYGQVFAMPRGITPPSGARVRDLADPTAKMGKSGTAHHGVIHLIDTPDVIAAKVRRATTDSDPVLTYEPATRPGVANMAVILGALTDRTPEEALLGLHGGASLKSAVTDAVVETLRPIQQASREVMDDQQALRVRLRADAHAVAGTVIDTVAAAQEAMGLMGV